MDFLEKINSPCDMKKLSISDLYILAEQIRSLIVDTVSKNGGHLGSNLGVVELTLALHKVFETPQDKLIWDVGHQSYIHKILTGRKEQFSTLRQFGGLCGFPNRSESEHDSFGTGHSSTSISAALGFAIARDLNNDDYNVVAVIGDGSFTGGMAFEALNNAGELQKKMLVVLNDNEMSIAKNVGALSEYLYRMRRAPTYSRIKRDIESVLRTIPAIGEQMSKTVERVKNSVKFLLVPGMLFEELGFNYIGPVDGHNIEKMVEIFELAKSSDKPTVVHVLTQKGKGYAPAEQKAERFHGVGPFEVKTGDKQQSSKRLTYTQVFSQAIIDVAQKDDKIVAITAAMPDGTGLTEFSHVFPNRFFDVGIAEQHAVTMAAGMACEGLKPVVALYSTFAQRAYDQIIHDVCLQNLPVVFALDRSGLVGDDGATHHGVFAYSFLRSMPNIVIMSPKDENELVAMIGAAFSLNKPVAILYPRGDGLGMPIDWQPQPLEFFKAQEVVVGQDVVVWAIGSMVARAKDVCDKLSKIGVKAGLVNARFAKPLDLELLQATAQKYKKIVTLEENALAGGFGSAILEALQDLGQLKFTEVLNLGFKDEFIAHGNKELLFRDLQLDVDSIVDKVTAFCRI